MSYTETSLLNEIADVVEASFSRQERIQAGAVALAVVTAHLPQFSAGGDFVAHCCWHTTRKAVGDYLTKRFRDDDGEFRQAEFPGFQGLQVAYLVRSKSGEEEVVPVELATEAELIQVEERLRAEGLAKLAHAERVRRFRQAKFQHRKSA